MNQDNNDPDIERWLNEGGMQLPAAAVAVLDPGILDDSERRVIACLGVAILSTWDEMPPNVRKRVLQMAVTNTTYDVALLKQKAARFLRGRKGSSKVAGGEDN